VKYHLWVFRQPLFSVSLPSLLVLVLCAAHVSGATNYYVDNAMTTSGNGSLAAPFRTIQEGLHHLAPGDTLWLRGNKEETRVYSENLVLPMSGTASQPITVTVYPAERVMLTGTTGTRLRIEKDYWTFDGLLIDQAGLAADAIKINAQHIVIKNAEIRNGQRDGISIEQAAFVTIQDSYIHDFMWVSDGQRMDAHCIIIETDRSPHITDITIHRNIIERCSGDGTQVFGVTGQDVSTYAKNIVFTNNTFIDGTTEPGLTENALDFKAATTVVIRGNTMTGYKNNKAVVIQKGCRSITVEDNVIRHGLSGIEMRQEGGPAFLQANHRVVGNLLHHLASYALKFDGVEDVVVIHNTLAYLGTEAFRFESSLGTSVPAVNRGMIKNNLIFAAGKAPAGVARLSQVKVGFNGWFLAPAGDMRSPSDTIGTESLFIDVANGKYALQTGSAVIDAGTPVGRAFIGPAPDLGAFEYNPGGASAPPAAPHHLKVSH
jgi:hypothetical protein